MKKIDFTVKGTKLPVIPRDIKYTINNSLDRPIKPLREFPGVYSNFFSHGVIDINNAVYVKAERQDYTEDNYFLFKLTDIEKLAEKTEIEILEEKVKQLQKQIEVLKNNKDYVLTLINVERELVIGYYIGDEFREVGYIENNGACSILGTNSQRYDYTRWVEEGMKIVEHVVEWRGKNYLLYDNYTINGEIYDFENCTPLHTQDDNILTYPNNNRTILH